MPGGLIPLFPLQVVVFPRTPLPLHIFEDRYRLMIRQCLAEDLPFGVVLIKRGQEVGDDAEPYTVGTVARIIESTHLNNGAMNIVTVHPSCYPMDLPSIMRQTDAEGLDYFEVPITFTEIGDE